MKGGKYGDDIIRMSANMADGNQQKNCYRGFLQTREFIPRGTRKH